MRLMVFCFMKDYLIDNYDAISMTFFLMAMLIFVLIIFISYIVNKDNYHEIVELYRAKYGEIPVTARIACHASLIATPGMYHAKVGFIMGTLIYPYNRVTNHNMTLDAYKFIRSLPSKLTLGFRVEGILWLALTFVVVIIVLEEFLIRI